MFSRLAPLGRAVAQPSVQRSVVSWGAWRVARANCPLPRRLTLPWRPRLALFFFSRRLASAETVRGMATLKDRT